MAGEPGRTVGDAPDEFVGVGEAAEFLGVPHVRLRSAIREGNLQTFTGRRGGRLVRMIRLGELIRLDPSVASRPLPELRPPDGAVLPEAGAASSVPTVADGSRPSGMEPGGPEPGEPEPAEPEPGGARSTAPPGQSPYERAPSAPAPRARRAPTEESADAESVRYLWRELERVRHQVRESRQAQGQLLDELLRSGEEARELFGRLAADEEARLQSHADLTRERVRIEKTLAEMRGVQQRTVRVGGLLVLLVMAAGFYAGRDRPARVEASGADEAISDDAGGAAQDSSGARRPGDQPDSEAMPGRPEGGHLQQGGLEVKNSSAAGSRATRSTSQGGSTPGDASRELSTGWVSSPATSASPTPQESGALETGTPDAGTPDAGSPDVGPPDVGAPDLLAPDSAASASVGSEGTDAVIPSEPAVTSSDAVVLTGLRESSDPSDREDATLESRGTEQAEPQAIPIGGRPNPGSRPGDRICELWGITRSATGVVSALGPCYGRWNPELEGVVGFHRHGDEAYCRQHDYFARDLGGSLDRAEQEAALARKEGLVPPMLRMRVELAARHVLGERVSGWLESGFEAGDIEQHRVEATAGGRWTVESWVRYIDFAGNERLRSFRLQLAIGIGSQPDLLFDFSWLDGAEGER